MKEKFFITTPIYYVNDVPHIGSAYTTLAADVLARAHRLLGHDVRFITGTDEHGAKIARKASEEGLEPQAYTNKIAKEFQATWKELKISHDTFVRTTDKSHIYLVGRAIEQLYADEYLYPAAYEGWYCVGCEEYKTIEPGTDTEKTPLCDIHGKPLEFVKETVYYFTLSKFQDELINQIEKNKLIIEPAERKNEVLAFLKGEPLRDIPFTRSKVSWGVPVPFDDDQTIYVWVDALLNYLSFSGVSIDPGANTGLQTRSTSDEKPKKSNWPAIYRAISSGMWPATLQIVGKDILRFHAVIWPAMLLALKLPLPKKLFVHGFFTVDGQKMSKSQGNVISPKQMIDRYGVEATRYLILSAFPFGSDGDISLEKFDTAYTSDLANNLGNLVQRTIVLINKFGIKPQVDRKEKKAIEKAYLAHDVTGVIQHIFQIVTDTNKYLATKQPWAMENDALRETVLVKAYEDLLTIAYYLTPLMPKTAEQIEKQLASLKPEPLFPRLN